MDHGIYKVNHSTVNIQHSFRAVWLLRNVGRCWKRNKNKNYRRTFPSIFLQIQSKKQKNINATTLLSRFYSPAVPVCSRPPCWSRGPRNWSQSSSSVNRSARSPTVRAEFSVSRDPVLCLVKKIKIEKEKRSLYCHAQFRVAHCYIRVQRLERALNRGSFREFLNCWVFEEILSIGLNLCKGILKSPIKTFFTYLTQAEVLDCKRVNIRDSTVPRMMKRWTWVGLGRI